MGGHLPTICTAVVGHAHQPTASASTSIVSQSVALKRLSCSRGMREEYFRRRSPDFVAPDNPPCLDRRWSILLGHSLHVPRCSSKHAALAWSLGSYENRAEELYRWNQLGLTYFLTQPCRRYGWTTTMRPVAVARVHRLPYCVSFSLANCHSIAHTAVTNTLERPEPPISKFLISNVQLTGCSN